jgi:hypothetical protein
MFTASDLLTLLHVCPFVPFRLILSDGGTVEVRLLKWSCLRVDLR